MGNTIPHGDRLHECNDRCPESPHRIAMQDDIGMAQARIDAARKQDKAMADARWMSVLTAIADKNRAMSELILEMYPAIHEAVSMEPVESKDFDFDACVDKEDFGAPGVGASYANLAAQLTHPPEKDKWVQWSPPSSFAAHRHEMVLGIAPQTALADRIMHQQLPRAMEHFLRRNAAYGDDNDFNLGSRGQYVDISRKVQKLKRLMWEERPELDGEESAETIVMELIGHLLMTLDYMAQEDAEKSEGR